MLNITVHAAAAPVARLLLVHGAGAPVQSPFFQQLIPRLTDHGIEVHSANFAYMELTRNGMRRVAPKAEKLVAEFAEMVQAVLSQRSDLPLWLGGKSMGGRVLSMYLATDLVAAPVAGAVVFGYPLCPPASVKDAEKAALTIAARSRCLNNLARPVLICQGSRDAFGTVSDIQRCLTGSAETSLSLLELTAADHDFAVLKRSGFTSEQIFSQAALATVEFIRRHHQGN